MAGCLLPMLKVGAIIVAFWLFLAGQPVWVPLLAEFLSSTLMPAMTPDLPTPTPGATP